MRETLTEQERIELAFLLSRLVSFVASMITAMLHSEEKELQWRKGCTTKEIVCAMKATELAKELGVAVEEWHAMNVAPMGNPQ